MKRKNKDLLSFKETWQLTKRACMIWQKYAPNLLLATFLYAAFSAVAPYVSIYFSAQLLNELAGTRDPERLRFWVLLTIGITAAFTLITSLLKHWKEVCLNPYWQRNNRITADKLLSMDFAAADAPKTHELLSQIKQNANWMGHGTLMVLWKIEPMVQAAAGICGAIALTVTLFTEKVPETAGGWTVLNHPVVMALMLIGVLLVTLLVPLCSNKAMGLLVRASESIKEGNRFFLYFGWFPQEDHRMKDIRMYAQDKVRRHYMVDDEIFSSSGPIARFARGPMGLWSGLSEGISAVFLGLAYVVVCLKAWAGAFGVGSVAQYVSAITALSSNIGKLISTLGELRGNAVFLKLTFEFLDIPNEMYQGSLTTEKRSDRQYEIEFRDVSFKYPGAEEYALRHVSMKFRVGERLAVVGQNGSGKTTFIKLLCRLYDPTEGVILLNGIDIRKYSYDEYIALFSVVFQDFQLMSFSLGENVAAAVEYDAQRVLDCLDKAGMSERLKTLPKGLDTMLNKDFDEEGVQVSGGEAQKIALARALYKDAPFVILDEPTAALDPIAEMEVYTKFDAICGDKTAVYISHRLSSCRFCDQIAVFDKGSIVQFGSHDQLVSDDDGKYAALWNAQAQYYVKKQQ
ncbi:MAG: ABC transporter ATP-binding protein [Clostridia bacterium]|nr:ABC transporter ATP-binding protein [Clostridia bacterium]